MDSMHQMVDAICLEMDLRNGYLPKGTPIETVYFGGGTPSLLSLESLDRIFNSIHKNFSLSESFECTLEANPDDLDKTKLTELKSTPINRLSIGVQSFHDSELVFMNRAHDSSQAIRSVYDSAEIGFDNITIDLIYGIPGSGIGKWATNLEQAFSLPVKHLSCYGLTIEPKTMLHKAVLSRHVLPEPDEAYAEQFSYLMDAAIAHGFEHYEISNFAKPGFRSRHNSRYWNNTSYIGLGPSAHSYNGMERSWNVPNNATYIRFLQSGNLSYTSEILSIKDKYNEHVMTRLRTIDGVSLDHICRNYGKEFEIHFNENVKQYLDSGHIMLKNGHYSLSRSGQHLADRIASDLFIV